ncbi:MAG: helix-turn-helix domain-containing protein [Alphaproteobacteria bacterium]|nr:helix-turn-helix domain-containing protein [Alphaproteobacteria bacterium]
MNTLFSTAEVHPRDRFDYWHSVACRTIVDHHSIPENPRHFSAELHAGKIADVDLVSFENSPIRIEHTDRHADQTAPDTLFLCRQLAGSLVLEQQGSDLLLEPGQLALIDPRFQYKGAFHCGSRLLLLKVPRAEMEARLGSTRSLLAVALRPTTPEVHFASDLVGMLPEHAAAATISAALLIRNQLLDTVALAFLSNPDMRARSSLARGLVRQRVRAAVRAQLTDPGASVDSVAAAARISVRYANAVLADENTSVMRLFLSERVEHCRQALQHPAQLHRTISDIAYGWGFSDMTHFGRAFKRAYGMSPRAFRSSLQQRVASDL